MMRFIWSPVTVTCRKESDKWHLGYSSRDGHFKQKGFSVITGKYLMIILMIIILITQACVKKSYFQASLKTVEIQRSSHLQYSVFVI